MTLYQIITANNRCRDLLGEEPRFYPHGMAEADEIRPYAVYQQVGGAPVKCVGGSANMDHELVQIDVYSDQYNSAQDAYNAIRNALEPYHEIASFNGRSRDPATKDWRITFTLSMFNQRERI